MATIDSNGVLIYQDTDNYTPIQTALNLAQSNLSSILGANTQIVRVSSVGDRNAKATARGSISKSNPFVAWRADAADGLQLEYTTNGTAWRVIADKEYYDAQDTGWVGVSLNSGFTVAANVQVRRIQAVIYWRGAVRSDTGWTSAYQNVISPSNIPSWAIGAGGTATSSPLAPNSSGMFALGVIDGTNGVRIATSITTANTVNINLKGFTGYTLA